MNPWEIAARLCRPMSTEEALGLTKAEFGFREIGDVDPSLELKFREMAKSLEQEDGHPPVFSSSEGSTPP